MKYLKIGLKNQSIFTETAKTLIFMFFLKQKIVAEFYLEFLANGGSPVLGSRQCHVK